MPTDFLAFLEGRRVKIRKHIQRLETELVELDKSEKLYRMSQKVHDRAPEPQLETLEDAEAPAKLPEEDRGKIAHGIALSIGGQTIKEAVCLLLSAHPNGLSSDEILASLRRSSMPDLERTSLSPQLSRLKQASAVYLHSGKWILASEKTEAEGGLQPPSASNGPV